MTATIIVTGADKGGVGKTTIARTLLDYLHLHQVPVRAFDTQPGTVNTPPGDLVRFAPEGIVKVIDIGDVRDQMQVFDGISDDVMTVLDLKAGELSPIIEALDNAHMLDEVRAGNIRMVLLHVLGSAFTSIREVAEIGRRLGPSVKHLLVKNYQTPDQYKEWDRDPEAQQIFAAVSDRTIIVPQLKPTIATKLQIEGVNFLAYLKNPDSRWLAGIVRTWLEQVHLEFDRVNVLGPDIADDGAAAAGNEEQTQ